MGACNTKDKDKKVLGKAISLSNKPVDIKQPEKVVNNITQSVPKPDIVDLKSQINQEKIIQDSTRKFKVKLIFDDTVIDEAIYKEDIKLKKIIKDASPKMKTMMLENITDKDTDYPEDFDFFLITQKASSDFQHGISEKVNITHRLSNDLNSFLSANLLDNQEIKIEILRSGLDISLDIRKALIQGTNIIASPKFESDPLELFLYDKTTNKNTYYSIQDDANDYMKYFSHFSAYCNGYNKLFISGGTTREEEYIATFVDIDLERILEPNRIRKLPNLNFPRSWHSMIFVPPRYVFIVGGSNTKAVEVYNIQTNEIKEDSILNENRSEPSLCVVNNTSLFAFCGFLMMRDFVDSIEKCNLRKKKRKWEMVNVKFERNILFEPSFFTVAYEKGNSIVLFGAHEIKGKSKGKNYVFRQDGDENIIDNYSVKDTEDYFTCSEKLFCPVDDKVSVLIPSYLSDTVRILYFDSDKRLIYQFKSESVMESTHGGKPSFGFHELNENIRETQLDKFRIETSDV